MQRNEYGINYLQHSEMARCRAGWVSNILIRTLSEGSWEPLVQNLVLLLNKLKVHAQNSIKPEIWDVFYPFKKRNNLAFAVELECFPGHCLTIWYEVVTHRSPFPNTDVETKGVISQGLGHCHQILPCQQKNSAIFIIRSNSTYCYLLIQPNNLRCIISFLPTVFITC